MNPNPLNQLFRSAASAVLAQAVLHTELLKVEWAEEKYRLTRMLVALLAGTVCLFMSLLSISAMALIYSWGTQYQNPVLLGLTFFYCTLTLVACYRFCALAALGKHAFADTRAELDADVALIRHKLGDGA